MERKIISVFIISLLLVACDKPNPEPEKLDPIYAAIEKELKEIEGGIATTQKSLDEFKEDFKKAVPQTGQIKFARKRVEEATAVLEKQKQMKKYLELRLQSRLQWDREHYLRAYNKKEAWPPPEEYEQYQSQRALEMAPRSWKNSERLEKSAIKAPKASSEGHSDAAPAKAEHH